MVFSSMVGALASLLVALVDPRVINKAGPDWLWMGGRDDVVRNLFFKPNGAFRRYGFIGLLATFGSGGAALFWILHRLAM
ncbi:MAG TPA: hypothetical protein VNU64_01045 [Burkholderiales bacterium]|nr:hypothetical protein [Burkholderiales bacterium]